MRSFVKRTTNIGNVVGVIIPKEVCYAEGIGKFQRVRVFIEPIIEPRNDAEGHSKPSDEQTGILSRELCFSFLGHSCAFGSITALEAS